VSTLGTNRCVRSAGLNKVKSLPMGETVMSFLGRLHEEQENIAAWNIDPWLFPLSHVRGKIDYDGFERVSSQAVLDILLVPQRDRRAGAYKRVCKLMVELGWAPVRVRDFARGGYKEQVRGYCRDARSQQPIHHS
jgi:hypothetical protein